MKATFPQFKVNASENLRKFSTNLDENGIDLLTKMV